MFSTSDTIVAIATPPGRGAIGVVRLSGPAAQRIATELIGREEPLVARRATFATLDTGVVRDHVVVTTFPHPASYTGEDVVEISTHGSAVILRSVVESALRQGARLAAPGEFTLRAYLNGKIDLVQAEAVADLIEAATPLQARSAFDQLNGTLASAIAPIDAELFDLIARLEASVDFPDEGYHFVEPGAVASAIDRVASRIDGLLSAAVRGRVIREGARVVIAGNPNAGKSSLFNALVGAHRAIVTALPGTTRDLLTEVVDLRGLRVTLVDTAGLTETDDPIEREGVERAGQAIDTADLVLLVCDRSREGPMPEDMRTSRDPSTFLVVASKADLPAAWHRDDAVLVSSATGEGLDALVDHIHRRLGTGEDVRESPMVSNVRHVELLTRARAALAHAADALVEADGVLPEEFVLADLQQARYRLEEVTGTRGSDAVLLHVFERFCVGK